MQGASPMTSEPCFALALALALATAACLSGCFPEECHRGDSYCDGDDFFSCFVAEGEEGGAWHSEACERCANHQCLKAEDRDPRCANSVDYCDGTDRVSCDRGYATQRESCLGGDPGWLCVQDSTSMF